MLPLVAREYAGWTQVWAPAKVNLFLRVVGKRADGYHELATHMLPVPIYDTILARPAGQLSLQCDDPGLPVDSGNLVMKAAWMLQERYAPGRGAEIELRKRIPHQAGMGEDPATPRLPWFVLTFCGSWVWVLMSWRLWPWSWAVMCPFSWVLDRLGAPGVVKI